MWPSCLRLTICRTLTSALNVIPRGVAWSRLLGPLIPAHVELDRALEDYHLNRGYPGYPPKMGGLLLRMLICVLFCLRIPFWVCKRDKEAMACTAMLLRQYKAWPGQSWGDSSYTRYHRSCSRSPPLQVRSGCKREKGNKGNHFFGGSESTHPEAKWHLRGTSMRWALPWPRSIALSRRPKPARHCVGYG